jgi:spermidine/putrescine transport system permease protein
MNQPDKKSIDFYAMTWRLPIIVWQTIFFVGPLLFMVAMSFFVVKNYRMIEAFEFTNWVKMLGRGYFWDSYLLTLGLATCPPSSPW